MIGSNTEELLRQLVKNTSPKLSNSLLLSGSTSNFTINFSPTIDLSQNAKYEVALIRLETYYSFPNIDSSNNLFKYSPNFGTTWNTITIPTGCYEISAINAYIQRSMKDAGYYDSTNSAYYITLSTNFNTLKTIISLAPNYKIDFTIPNSLRTVLGFNSQIYSAVSTSQGNSFESENIVNILSVNEILVHADIIGGSYINGSSKSVLYSFFPGVGPGYKIIEVPKNLVYLPITRERIDSINIRLTDQDGKELDLRGETLTIRLHLREV